MTMAAASTAPAASPPKPPQAAEAYASNVPQPKRTNPWLVLSYLTIVGVWGMSQVVLIPYVAHLLLLVTAIIYAACHASLVLREEPGEVIDEQTGAVSEHSGVSSDRETLRKEDAYHFPLVGSVSLFSLYLAFKYLDKDLVNLLIGGYFCIVGCLALTTTVLPFVQFVSPSPFKRKYGWTYLQKHSLPEWVAGPSPWDLSLEFTLDHVVSLLASAAVCVLYFQSKPWYLNNVLGIAFCLQGIERFSLGTYKIASILLIGLFFYDIFWVFGTEVMVSVAKNLEGPIKILFPRTLTKDPETGKLDMSLLGLGDIVIPGFFLALMLRFDAHNAQQPTNRTDYHAHFPKPYFLSTLTAYVAGLVTTLFVMIQFNAAQPALLYLVPACLGSSFLCAVVRGEVKDLLDYSEEVPEEEEETDDDDEDEKDTTEDTNSKKDN
jgi:minor histocompatibility antigen H13